MNVKGKVILITGGAGGLGRAMAGVLAQNGAKVVLMDLDERGAEAAAELGHGARFYRMDVTSEADWAACVGRAASELGRVDVLINNAGINIRKPIEEMSIEEWNRMMAVNTGSVFLGTKYALPVMRAQGGGAIINTSSVCGLIGHRYTPEAYTASKGAVTLLTRSVAARYAKDGIRCNSIHPSTVDTQLLREKLQDPAFRAERVGEVPLGRLATPMDVANAALYLASDEAAFINGCALTVDGGVTCC